jgi:hypothetical protein
VVEPFEDAASKNTPPVLRFEQGGRTFTGPPATVAAQYTTTLPNPLTLTTWVTDEGQKLNLEPTATDPAGPGRGVGGRGSRAADGINPPLAIAWSVFRGPGRVTFDHPKPSIDPAARGGKSTATATFSAPGEYVLRVQANDASGDGGGGFQCCWTNAHVRVVVKPAGATR